jgi:hypothetical protein
VADLKVRDNKKLKGDVWEVFCQTYLQVTGKYQEVWLWNQVPDEVRAALRLTSRVDNGIDIIASTTTGYTAIQCKYRGKTNGSVPWGTLATFVGLCAATGPYEKHIVMTNCRGVTRRVPRGPKDKSICYGTFKGLSREMWMKMAGDWVEHRLTDADAPADLNLPTGLNLPQIQPTEPKNDRPAAQKPTPEELRELRLRRFQ